MKIFFSPAGGGGGGNGVAAQGGSLEVADRAGAKGGDGIVIIRFPWTAP